MNLRTTLVASAVALLTLASQAPLAGTAEAGVTFSFTDLVMTNGTSGDPLLVASGSVEIPRISKSPPSDLSVNWKIPESVDFSITQNGDIIRSFQDPTYFIYMDGVFPDGIYWLYVYPGLPGGRLDSLWDQLYLNFDLGMVYGDFSTISFYPGFSAVRDVPFVESAPETPTWTMMLLGFVGLGFVAVRKSLALK